MFPPNLKRIKAKTPYQLELVYETGERKLFDAAPYIRGSWFGELRDPSYFSAVRLIDGGEGIEWPNGQDIAPHELYELSSIQERTSPCP